jgi:hypothetical protein
VSVATIGEQGVDPATLRLLTSLAWMACGLLTGFLAFVQLGFVGTILDDGSLTALAAWNGIVAAAVLYGAVKLLSATQRPSFRTSAMWAAVVVVLQGFQVAQGATHFAYVGSTVAALAAGVLALTTYNALPAQADPTSVDEAPSAYERAQTRPAYQRLLIAFVALLAVLAVLWIAGQVTG